MVSVVLKRGFHVTGRFLSRPRDACACESPGEGGRGGVRASRADEGPWTVAEAGSGGRGPRVSGAACFLIGERNRPLLVEQTWEQRPRGATVWSHP